MSFHTDSLIGFFVAVMKTFDGVSIEDVMYCSNHEYGSGIKTQLLYAPAHFFNSFILPNPQSDYSQILTIKKENVEFRGKGGWCCIDILIEENELRSLLSGQVRRKKMKSELDFYILGFKDHNLGFIEKHKNTPFVFGIVDANGIPWLLGNLRNYAFFDSAEAVSGKKYEDNSGITIKITSNSPIYRFDSNIDDIAKSGAFTKGFTLGFNS